MTVDNSAELLELRRRRRRRRKRKRAEQGRRKRKRAEQGRRKRLKQWMNDGCILSHLQFGARRLKSGFGAWSELVGWLDAWVGGWKEVMCHGKLITEILIRSNVKSQYRRSAQRENVISCQSCDSTAQGEVGQPWVQLQEKMKKCCKDSFCKTGNKTTYLRAGTSDQEWRVVRLSCSTRWWIILQYCSEMF